MSSAESLPERAARLDREIAEAERALEASRASTASLVEEGAKLDDLLGRRSEALPLAPLVWTMIGTLLALGAGFSTYLVSMLVLRSSHGPHSDTPIVIGLWLAACALAAGALRLGRKPGAGGAARRGLRTLGWTLIGLSSICGGAIVTFASFADFVGGLD